eukprot:TRINITY_DN3580_c0_g2_i18.p1 TRINITY_DN3580_c0_g2~~TRINITY_DN3580_c0_g2_i18.p1  ORF type:complete len:441 (-),score=83.69 TRINITY_DN3580_c0_g2_i18:52-1374(-)
MMETKFFKLPFLFRLLERHLERLKQDENCVPAGQIQGNSEILLTRDHAEVVDENQKFPNLVAKKCYMCKLVVMEEMTEVGTVLCRACCHLNSVKRNQWVDLSSKVAMVTGGRVKIGFQTALKLLRCRAIVIVTTRFPADCLRRYKEEKDFTDWSHNLHIYGTDFRNLVHLNELLQHICGNYSRLDMIINNAAQTIRRPPIFYSHLIHEEVSLDIPHNSQVKSIGINPFALISKSKEMAITPTMPPTGLLPALLTQIPLLSCDSAYGATEFPIGELDKDGQQVDLRNDNSWTLKISEISPTEMIEVQIVNSISPFLIVSQLLPLMKKVSGLKFIVNVSSVEGQFSNMKSEYHPHTNMAKAALNMLTCTCALSLSEENIFMNSVDTGWISKMGPQPQQVESRKVPLTSEDGAARVLDPILTGFSNGFGEWGKYYKHFISTSW